MAIKRLKQAKRITEALPSGSDRAATEERISILFELARGLCKRDDPGAAVRAQREVVEILGGLTDAEAPPTLRLSLALRTLGGMYRQAGQLPQALDAFQAALDCQVAALKKAGDVAVVEGDPICADLDRLFVDCAKEFIAALTADRRYREADQLVDTIVRERGYLDAARLGERRITGVVQLTSPAFFEDDVAEVLAKADKEMANWLKSCSDIEARLLLMLNADQGVVEGLAKECRTVSRRGDFEAFQASVGLLDWWPTQGFVERMADYYTSISLLQRITEQLVDEASLASAQIQARLRGIAADDVNALRDVLGRGAVPSPYVLRVTPDDAEQTEPECSGRSDGTQSNGGQVLCLTIEREVIFPLDLDDVQAWRLSADYFDYTFAQCFHMLDERRQHGGRRLRRCKMPASTTGWLDHLLKEKEDSPPLCGTYYITNREDRITCNRAICRRRSYELRDVQEALAERAEQLGLRRRRRASQPGRTPKKT